MLAALQGYQERAKAAGRHVDRVIATYEAGWSGFWLARLLATHGVETHVVQPSSVLVDRRARRAKSDGIDAELLLRTLLAWLRGEPRVCSMVPIPAEGDEDARRSLRERTELVAERVALVNRIGAVLATLGCGDYDPLLRNRRQRLGELRTALGTSLPVHAHAKINRMLDRLDLVRTQIAELEQDRDAVLEEQIPDKAGEMIQQLTKLRGIGVQSATVLVREAFVRDFANGKSLGLVRRPLSDALQQRWHRPRAGHQQGREPPAANRNDRAGLALAALPARLGRSELVSRSRQRHRSAHAQGHGGRFGTEAADSVVAVRHSGRDPGRCGDEARILISPRS